MRTNPLQGKKIVIDGRFLAAHRGGISRYTGELVKSILNLKLGIDLKLIVRSDEPFDPALKKALDATSEKVEVIGTRAVHYSAKEQLEYLKLLNSFNADLAHFTNFNHPVRYKKPFVVTIHDLTLHNFPNKDNGFMPTSCATPCATLESFLPFPNLPNAILLKIIECRAVKSK
jgi:glycosyltransferase involved in cell wall biosynthesis